MYKEGGVDSFENIANKYGLPSNHFYRYLQVRSYLREKLQISTLGDLHPLLRYMVKTHQSHNLKNTTKQIYQILRESKKENLYYIKDKWEKELEITIPDDEWNQSFKDIFHYIRSPFWQEYAWKINIRYFRTPSTISKYMQNNSSCWRECGENNVDHTHIFFTCKKKYKPTGQMCYV